MQWEPLNPLMKNLEIQVVTYAQIKDELERVAKLKAVYYKQFVDELDTATKNLENITCTQKTLHQKLESIKDDLEKAKPTIEQLNADVDKYEFESDIVRLFCS